MEKITITKPLKGLESPYSAESENLLNQLGHVFGLLMEAKVKNGEDALFVLNRLRNATAAQNNLQTAFVCQGLSDGLLAAIKVSGNYPLTLASTPKLKEVKVSQPKK